MHGKVWQLVTYSLLHASFEPRVFQHAHALVHWRVSGTRLGAATIHRVLHVLRCGRRFGYHCRLLHSFSWDESANRNGGRVRRHFRTADGLWDSLCRSGNVSVSAAVHGSRPNTWSASGSWSRSVAVFGPDQSGVAVFAHLGGLLFGFLFVKFMPLAGSAMRRRNAILACGILIIAGSGGARRGNSKST